MRQYRLVGALAVTGAALLMVGCAAVSAPSSTRTPSSSPSTGEPAPSDPMFSGAAGCTGLLSVADVQAEVVAPISVVHDEASPPRSAGDVAVAQAGGIICTWGGERMTDASYDDGISVTMVPDPDGARATWLEQSPPQARCGVEGGSRCVADVDVSGYWASISFSDSERDGDTVDALNARFARLLALLSSRTARPAASAWMPPTGSFDGTVLCTDVGARLLETSTGRAAGSLRLDAPTDSRDILTTALDRVRAATCSYGNRAVMVTTVPGGAWILTGARAEPPSRPFIGVMQERRIDGADRAFIGCGESCVALISYRGSYVEVADGDLVPLDDLASRVASLVGGLEH